MQWLIALAIIFMLLALLALVLRRVTGPRVTLSGDRGRARQPRLGIVDVYDLDRQRQLILLRRDNVEHLLLVGGPNDVVVETNIVRGASARLPAAPDTGDRLEGPAEKLPEIAPTRPVADPPAGRPDPVAGHLGRLETAPSRGQGPKSVEASAKAAPAPAPRPMERARQALMPIASAARAARPATPTPRPGNGASAAREPEGGNRAVLTDMARQLEDVLNRPSPPPAPEPVREPPPPPSPKRPEPVAQIPQPPPSPSQRQEPAPQQQAGGTSPAGRPATAEAGAAPPLRPAAARPAEPAKPPGPPSAPELQPPPPANESAPPSPPSARKPEPPPELAPVSTGTARPDPFSIEDIEAEFARLLGRPLERKDGK